MNTKQILPRSFWLTLVVFTFLVNLAMLRLSYLRLMELGANPLRTAWGVGLLFCFVILSICAWLFVYIIRFGTLPFNLLSSSRRRGWSRSW